MNSAMAAQTGTISSGAPEELTSLDATFLELEQLDPAVHMHIGGVMTFEPRPGKRGAPSAEEVGHLLGERLTAMQRYRQRLSTATTGGLHWPTWEADPAFDLAAHVRRVRLPGRGGDDELREWAGDYYSNRLDRSRPLWELVVISGLEGGRWALASKTHHCMIDGVGSVDAALVMLDAEPHPAPRPATEEEPLREAADDPEASRTGGILDRVPGSSILKLPLRTASALLGAGRSGAAMATHPSQARETARRSRAMVEMLIRSELIAAPQTSLNTPIGGKRRPETVEVPLQSVRDIKQRLGGTVNDVILAVIASGLRDLLLARGEEPPERGLRAMVPVNLRSAGDQLAIGNRITSLFVPIAVAEPDAWQRYRHQMQDAESLKSGDQGLGSSAVIDFAGHAPPILHGMIARSLYATRLFNLTITNVPGPQQPLYSFGTKMLSVWPVVPLAAEHTLGIAIFSYDGRLFITANGDFDSTHDIDVLMDGIGAAVAQLERIET